MLEHGVASWWVERAGLGMGGAGAGGARLVGELGRGSGGVGAKAWTSGRARRCGLSVRSGAEAGNRAELLRFPR